MHPGFYKIRTGILDLSTNDQKNKINRLEDFLELSSDWLWELDKDLRYSFFSPGFAGEERISFVS